MIRLEQQRGEEIETDGQVGVLHANARGEASVDGFRTAHSI